MRTTIRSICSQLCVLSLLAAGTSSAAAQLGRMSGMLPDKTVACVEWSKLSGEQAPLRSLLAAARSPFAKMAFEHGYEHVAAAAAAAERLARYEGALGFMPGAGHPELVVIIDAQGEAESLAAALQRVVATADADEPAAIESITVQGVSFSHAADGPLQGVLWATHQNRFMVATSPKSAEWLLASSADGSKTRLAENADWQTAFRKFTVTADWHLTLWGSVAPVVKALQDGEASEVFDHIGIDKLRSFVMHVDETEHGARVQCYTHTTGDGLVSRLYRQRPLSDRDLACVPQDASYAYIGRCDLSQLYADVLEVADRVTPAGREQIENGVALGAALLGFSLTDLLNCFGDKWAIYDAPQHGGLLFTGAVLVADVRDADALEGILARVVQVANAAMRSASEFGCEIRELKNGAHTVRYILATGLPVPIAPAWGVADGQWVLALHPQTAVLALRQLDPATRKGSLLDNSEFKRVRPLLPKELVSVSFVDGRAYAQVNHALQQLVQTMLASLTANDPEAYDLARVPLYPDQLAKLRSYIGGYANGPDGIVYVGYGNSPLSLFFDGGSITSTAVLLGVLMPSLSRAREQAKVAVSMANLRAIGMGCLLYANDHQGRFPETLEQLVQQDLLPHQLRSPRDPAEDGEEPSYILIRGQTSSAPPQNVLAHERLFGQERVPTLFVDGHVELLEVPELRRRLDRQRSGGEGSKMD